MVDIFKDTGVAPPSQNNQPDGEEPRGGTDIFADMGVEPPQDESQQVGGFRNSIRNLNSRVTSLAGNLIEAPGTAIELGEQYLTDLTGVNPGVMMGDAEELRGQGYEPDFSIGDFGVDFTRDVNPDDTASGFNKIGRFVEDQDFGYEPRNTMETVAEDPSVANVAGFIGEQGPAALVDMAGLFANPLLYGAARTQEIADERVKNDNRGAPRTEFERRIQNPSDYPVMENEDGTQSTHRMASAEVDGRQIAYPTIVPQGESGELVQLDDDQALQYALQNGEFVEFPSEEKAQQYAEGGYKDMWGEAEKAVPYLPTPSDLNIAGSTATGSLLLDRFALNKLIPGRGGDSPVETGVDVVTSTAKKGGDSPVETGVDVVTSTVKKGGTEAGTEAVQEGGIEYAGETLGTEKEYSPKEAALRAAGGAILGTATGTAVGGASSLAEWRGNVRQRLQEDGIDDSLVTDAEIDELITRIEAASAEGQLGPDQVGQFVDDIVGVNRPEQQDPQQARQTSQELGALFEGTDVLARDDIEMNPEGEAVPREGATPVRTRTGDQATPDQYGAQAIVGRIVEEDGLTLSQADFDNAVRDIAADANADPREIARSYSEEGRRQAFDIADARRRRKERDRRNEEGPQRDYAAGAGREEDLTPRQRQDLNERSLEPQPGVNVGQPGQPRNSTDRITTSALYGLRGEFQPGQRPGPDDGQSGPQGTTFNQRPDNRVESQQPRLDDESGIGPREQTIREADRQGRFEGYAPNDIRSFEELGRAADAAERAVDQSNLPDAQKEAGRDYIGNIFDGVGRRGDMSITEATDAIRQYEREVSGNAETAGGQNTRGAQTDNPDPATADEAGPDAATAGADTNARSQAEPEQTAQAEPRADTQSEPQTETDAEAQRGDQESTADATDTTDADTVAREDLGGDRGFDQTPRDARKNPLPEEENAVRQIMRDADGSPVRAAELLAERSPTAAYRTIAKVIARALRKMEKAGVTMRLITGRAKKYRGKSSVTIRGERNYTVTVNVSREGGMTHSTLLHELVHAATQLTIDASKNGYLKDSKVNRAVRDMENLFKFIKRRYNSEVSDLVTGQGNPSAATQNLASTNNNAFQNVDEMVAWGLTDRDFQRFMEETPYSYGGSIWSRFVNKMRDMLGIPAKQESALSELLRTVAVVADADQAAVTEDYSAGLAGNRGGGRRGAEDNPRVQIESYQVDNDKPGVSKDPEFKPNKIVQAIRNIAGKEADEYGMFAETISMLVDTMRQVSGGARASSRATQNSVLKDFWRLTLASSDGDLRTLIKKFNSETLAKIPDMFHATAGNAAATRNFDEAVQSRNKRLSDIDKIISTMRDNGIKTKAQHAQVIRLIENPRANRRGAIGDAANKIEKYLKDELAYLREAGVDVGEVKDGYFPREMDAGKVDQDRNKFMTQAIKAYRKMGLSDDAADSAAQAYWESIVYGMSGRPGFDPPSGQTPSFIEGRVFSKEAAKFLDDFRVTDIDAVLGSYTQRATRRAEIARRFGDNWSEWSDMEAKMIEEDPEVRGILPQVRDLVAASAGLQRGNLRHGTRSTLSLLRTVTTLATLPKSAMSSLGELVIAPTRGSTGAIPGDLGYQMLNLVEHFINTARWVSGLGRSEKLQTMFDQAEDIGIIAGTGHNSLMAARFAGGDPVGRAQSKVISGFFKANLLEYLTNYTRVTSMRYGQVFMRRVAKQMQKHPSRSGQFLRELGVPEGREKAFADWMLKQEDGLAENPVGEFRDIYRNGLQRFVDQTVMRPSNSTRPKWATHPTGAVVFQLQNFAYSFQKNVINRQVRTINNLEGLDKLAYSASMLSGMALLVGAQGMFRYLRDEIYNEEINDRKTDAAFVEGAFSQAGLFGVADTYLQQLSGIRYQRSIVQMFLGPGLGGVTDAADDFAAAGLNNSDNTNTAERNRAKSVYDWMLEPVMQAGLSIAPGGPITRPLTNFATIYAVPKGRDPFAEAVAGPEREREKRDIESTFEFLFGGDSGSSSTDRRGDSRRSSGRGDSRREDSRR